MTGLTRRDFRIHKNLASLMASEDVGMVHGNYSTASVDLKTRIIRMPIFQTHVSDNVYNMMIAHEVGHLLFTPERGWHDAIAIEGLPKGPTNVVEDCRQERKIKLKYSSLYHVFDVAYKELFEMGFFGVDEDGLKDLSFIDKFNIRAKCGGWLDVPMTANEDILYDYIDGYTETFEDVCAIVRMLVEYLDEEDMDTSFEGDIEISEGDDDSEGEEGGSQDIPTIPAEDLPDEVKEALEEMAKLVSAGKSKPMESDTDTAHRKNEETLSIMSETRCLRTTSAYIRSIVQTENDERATPLYQSFVRDKKHFIGIMMSEFNLRKNASAQKRVQRSRSGVIDPTRLAGYRTNPNLFKTRTTVTKQQSHVAQLYLDFSGSMDGTALKIVIEQAAVVAEFCRRQNIPFQAYGWTNTWSRYGKPNLNAERGVDLGDFKLDLLVDTTSKDYTNMMDIMLARQYQLGGTPLVEAKYASFILGNMFKRAQGAEKLHIMMLTDGMGNSHSLETGEHDNGRYENFMMEIDGRSQLYTMEDSVSDMEAIDHVIKDMTESYVGYYVNTGAQFVFKEKPSKGFDAFYDIGTGMSFDNENERYNQKLLCSQLARNIA